VAAGAAASGRRHSAAPPGRATARRLGGTRRCPASAALLVVVVGSFLIARACDPSNPAATSAGVQPSAAAPVGPQPAPLRQPRANTGPTAVAEGAGDELDPGETALQLRGTVADTGGGPIASARIEARSTRARSAGGIQERTFVTSTDDRGAFVLRVPPGDHTVLANKVGYAGEERLLQLASDFEHTFRLNPEARIGGVVLDGAGGAPVEGARVSVDDPDGDAPAVEETRTGSDGTFLLRSARLV
jgi:hypothetical protein